ncbi:MAG: hypothetical protein ACI9H8_000976 [Lysobacterales bacterium]|jgi:hypothetical protein
MFFKPKNIALFLLFQTFALCDPLHAGTDLVWAVNVGGPEYEGIDDEIFPQRMVVDYVRV